MKAIFGLCLTIGLSANSLGQVWTEFADADEVSPQVTNGFGPLTTIVGSTDQLGDPGADLFCIRVTDWSQFSASLAGGAEFDTQIFLFTAGNLGIAANDDGVGSQSVLPVGEPLYSGRFNNEIVNIAVSGSDRDPGSSGGMIFPNTSTGVVGPTGPGGAQPIENWVNNPILGSYTLTLTGATYAVPEPGTAGMLGLFAFGLLRRRG